MEKDKMIDKVCEKMCAVYFDNDGTCSFDGLLCHDDKQCVNRQNAKDLIDELIPEGSVVLTREEYEELKQRPEKVHNEMDERMKAELAIEKRMGEKKAEQASKKTAKEILDDVFSPWHEIGGDFYELTLKDKIVLYKKYVVEVKQNG